MTDGYDTEDNEMHEDDDLLQEEKTRTEYTGSFIRTNYAQDKTDARTRLGTLRDVCYYYRRARIVYARTTLRTRTHVRYSYTASINVQ